MAIKKNCTNTPKLSEKYSSAMISKQIAGQALLKMQEVHKGSHKNSIEFDIQLGYFNSAAINILSTSFATFILNGGRMRMAINQIVSKEDKETITEGFAG
ncbi:MAG: hypothetical protein UHD64_05980, partial [Bacteroidales bacterium]|nr:hypothetical protein [Bacteroidales bacterium]